MRRHEAGPSGGGPDQGDAVHHRRRGRRIGLAADGHGDAEHLAGRDEANHNLLPVRA